MGDGADVNPPPVKKIKTQHQEENDITVSASSDVLDALGDATSTHAPTAVDAPLSANTSNETGPKTAVLSVSARDIDMLHVQQSIKRGRSEDVADEINEWELVTIDGVECERHKDTKDTRRLLAGARCDDVDAVVDSIAMHALVEELIKDKKELRALTAARLGQKVPLVVKAESKAAISHKLTTALGFEELATPMTDASFAISTAVIRRNSKRNGNGFYADRDIEDGTLLLVEKPLVSILDKELSGQPWEEDDSGDTQGLFVALGKKRDQIIPWLTHFHPLESSNADIGENDSCVKESDSEKKEEKRRYPEADASAWTTNADQKRAVDTRAMERYRSICQLNSLGFYTNSEQICYNYTYRPLTGTGIYALSSTFNHSCEPNVGRYSLGDVCFFRTNRPVKKGDELCISYCEVELLAEKKRIRHQALDRDFTCECPKCAKDTDDSDEGPPKYTEVNYELLAELALLPAEERCDTIVDILSGKMQLDDGSYPAVLSKDAQDLRCVLGKAYMECALQLKTTNSCSPEKVKVTYLCARQVWRDAADWTMKACPNDEGVVVFLNQALLCDLEMNPECRRTLQDVLKVHKVAFGGGGTWYRLRYDREVQESFVSEETKIAWRLCVEENS